MKIKFIYLFILIASVSCSDKKELNIQFDENIEVDDLLNQTQYLKLYNDEDYKDYINEVFENTVEMHSIVIKGSELMAESNLVGDEIGNDMSVDLFFSGLKGAGAMAMEGFTMMGLEDDKKELYASFSNSKIAIADEFEEKVIEILKASNIAPENPNVEPTDMLLNYKSYGSEIKNDDRLRDNLADLTDDVDELFVLSYKIRIQQNFNIALGNEIDDFSQITNLGLKILEDNGNYSINVDSDMLDKYFESVSDILKGINRIESNLSIPVEDWSENKRLNYQFVIDDIKIKLKEDILSFKLNPKKQELIISDTISESPANEKTEIEKKLDIIVENYTKKIESEDYIGALAELEKGIIIAPNNGDLYSIRGYTYLRLDQPENAISDLEKAKQLSKNRDSNIYHQLAIAKFQLEDWDGVIDETSNILNFDPTEVQRIHAYHFRGVAKVYLEIYENAIEDLDKSIELQGEDLQTSSHFWRAKSKYQLEDYNGSLQDYSVSEERYPDNPLLYSNRAKTYETLEDYNSAIEDYTMAIELSPDEAYLYVKRAKANMNLSNYDKAISDCDKALELEPQNGDTYLLRGKAKMAIGKNDEACKDIHLAKEYGESEGTVDYAISEFCSDKVAY